VRQPKASPRDHKPRVKVAPWAITTLAIVTVSGLLASIWPAAASLRRSQAARLVETGNQASGHTAELNYRLANLLDHGNPIAALHLATLELASGQARAAHDTLTPALAAGQGSALLAIDAQAQLESGDTSDAAAAARRLAAITANQDQLAIAAVVLAAAGQGSDVATLKARVTAPEATGRINRAESGNIALAQDLASHGLLVSSSAILEKLPSTAPRDLLLAKIKATSHDKARRREAADLYRSYLATVPTDAATRLTYASLLDQLGRTTDAATQRALAASLISGRP
jgi:hypothetical protein